MNGKKIAWIGFIFGIFCMFSGCGNTTAYNFGYLKSVNDSIQRASYVFHIGYDNDSAVFLTENDVKYQGTFFAEWDSDLDGMQNYKIQIKDCEIINHYSFSSRKQGTVEVSVNGEHVATYQIKKQRYYLAVGWYVVEEDYGDGIKNPSEAYFIHCEDMEKYRMSLDEQWESALWDWMGFEEKKETEDFIRQIVGDHISQIHDNGELNCIEVGVDGTIYIFPYTSTPKKVYNEQGNEIGHTTIYKLNGTYSIQ